MNFAEFFAMGGYASYVWGSFGITAAVLCLNGIAARLQRKNVAAEVRATLAEGTELAP